MSTIFHFIWMEGQERRKKPAAGGHPKMQLASRGKKLRFPRSYRRSVRKAPFVTFPPKIKAIVKARYAKRDSRWQGHIRGFIDYIVDKDKSRFEDRRMFNADRMDISPEEAIQRLTALCGKDIALTKLILSPGDNSIDQVEYARHTMSELEKSMGVKLEWFSAPHYNTDKYHSHIALAGVVPEQDRDPLDPNNPAEAFRIKLAKELEGRDLRLAVEDLDLLRNVGDEFLMQERMLDYKLDRLIERELGLKDWSRQHDIADLIPERDWNKYQEELKSLGLPLQQYDRKLAKEFGYDRYFDLGIIFTDKYDLDHAKYLQQLQQSRSDEREPDSRNDKSPEQSPDRSPDSPPQDQGDPSEETNTPPDAAGDLIYGLQTTSGGQPDWDNERLGDLLYSAQLPEPEPERDIIDRGLIDGPQTGDPENRKQERKHDDRGDR